jgi:Ni,Fe-hydrogenase III large subunit
LNTFEESFRPMSERLFSLSSALMRMEGIGKVTANQMMRIGAVGMTARMAGLARDIRISHPSDTYAYFPVKGQTLEGGDIWARAYLRMLEIENSIAYIRSLIAELASLNEPVQKPANENDLTLAPDSLCVTLAEGWRGEICHCAITNSEGAIIHYKVKDPSLHNWMALALSLRNLEISDFPINNKSYNLSYCGHDL